jgi:hypothetical protein
MKRFSKVLLLLPLVLPALVDAHPSIAQKSGEINGKTASTEPCPFARRRTSAELDAAKVEAEERLSKWDETAAEDKRLYTPGKPSSGETYCDGSNEHKYCNKLLGAWGDSIPQDDTHFGKYCAWLLLEFQDPNEFNMNQLGYNTSAFGTRADSTLNAIEWKENFGEVMTYASTGGVAMSGEGNVESPWPVSSIIWRNGNKYAKHWVLKNHRPTQTQGYDWGFTLHGHYKAVECAKVAPMLEKYDLIAEGKQPDGSFRKFWNAFSEIEDLTPKFYKDECTIGPCPLKALDETPTSSSSKMLKLKGGISLAISMAAILFI